MTTNCLNCNAEINGQFCSNCGQSSETHKINLHYLWHDIQHGLLHFDKGILFTAKELFTRPGHSIREFLDGKRVSHFKPISLVIILAGIYSLLSHFFHLNLFSTYYELKGSGDGFNEFKTSVDKLSEWLSQHYSVLALIQIPIFSLGTYVMFKREGYNYVEHLVINCFIAGQKLILHILTFPIYYWLNNTKFSRPIDQFIDVVGYALAFWTIFQLFKRIIVSNRIWKTIFSLIIPLVTFVVVFFLIATILIYAIK
ncbi:MAG: DUF3667 domain-containing protein [Saprospiraceae bacterium]|nr:MAG: DUF3667 domain-containing protein [Saprospiraceae bacterium]